MTLTFDSEDHATIAQHHAEDVAGADATITRHGRILDITGTDANAYAVRQLTDVYRWWIVAT